MKPSSPILCSLLAAASIAGPVPNQLKDLKVSTLSWYKEIKRDVDVAIDGKSVRLEGGYVRKTDLDRLGWNVVVREGMKARQVDVGGTATRSGWGYIKGRDEKREVDVDGTATRSGWGYIKRGEVKVQ